MATNFDRNDITTYRGDDLAFNVFFHEENDDESVPPTPINVTGWTLYFTVKIHRDDDDAHAILSKQYTNSVDPQLGNIFVTVSHTETYDITGPMFYDLQVKKLDNTILTVTSGNINFLKEITRRIS